MKKKIFIISSIIAVIVIALSVTSLFVFKKEYVENVEYTLTGEHIDFGNVKYAVSDKGLIAIEVIDKEQEVVSVLSYDSKIYSIATGFLKDNPNIKTLNLHSSTFFESRCIENCVNLKEIVLNYSASSDLSTEKDAFIINKDTSLMIKNISYFEQYVYSLQNYKNHLSFVGDVYANYEFNFSHFLPNEIYNEKICDEKVELHVKGTLYGQKVNAFTRNDLEFVNSKILFNKDDKITSLRKFNKTSLNVDYKINYNSCFEILFLSNCENHNFEGSFSIDRTYNNRTNNLSTDISNLDFYIYLSYN